MEGGAGWATGRPVAGGRANIPLYARRNAEHEVRGVQVRLRAAVVGTALVLTAASATGVAVVGLPTAKQTTAAKTTAPQTTTQQAVGPGPAPLGTVPTPSASPPPVADITATQQGGPSQTAAVVAPKPAPVAPLKALLAPDLMVTLPRTLSPAQVARLRKVGGVADLTLLDVATVKVGGRPARVVGVDPSQFRAYTPRETASSDPLWGAVARGELAPTYGLSRDRKLVLGGNLTVQGTGPVRQRVGALAVYGLPGVDVVADRAAAQALGARPASAVLLAAPSRGIDGLQSAVRQVVGGGATVQVLRQQQVQVYKGKPRNYRELYIASAHYCPGLRWQVLAAIGQVESNHGRNAGRSSAGALGPMQFLPSTWAGSGVDGDGDGKKDIQNPYDAVPAAALYLCQYGAGQGGQQLYDAVFAYNHADWYVKLVLGLAAKYR